jgi:hypothetical protein
LELNSCKPQQAAQLVNALAEKDDDPQLILALREVLI